MSDSSQTLWQAALDRIFSAPERAALRLWRREREVAALHRAGLAKLKREPQLLQPARLNLGSGRFRKEGFVNIDLGPSADVTLDLRQGLPFDSSSSGFIFSEHCFEHFDYPTGIEVLLRDCLRVLRPGAEMQFSVPDTQWPLEAYASNEGLSGAYYRVCRERNWHPASCTTRLEHINYHFRQRGEHRYAYDEETAVKLLTGVGFVAVGRRPYDPVLDSAHRELGSLFMIATKPALTPTSHGHALESKAAAMPVATSSRPQ
ncbi:MAG: methyltransferase domain-containing protein [Gemmatimonadota bacterium]